MGTALGSPTMKVLLRGMALVLGIVSLFVGIAGLNDIASGFTSSIAQGTGRIMFSITIGILGVNLGVLSRS